MATTTKVVGIGIPAPALEEPSLLRVHGDAYLAGAARTGRFLPWIGRLRD